MSVFIIVILTNEKRDSSFSMYFDMAQLLCINCPDMTRRLTGAFV